MPPSAVINAKCTPLVRESLRQRFSPLIFGSQTPSQLNRFNFRRQYTVNTGRTALSAGSAASLLPLSRSLRPPRYTTAVTAAAAQGSCLVMHRLARVSQELAFSTTTTASQSPNTNNTNNNNPEMSDYSVHQIGAKNTLDYRAYIKDSEGKIVSPFHDIPLYANAEKTILNMVVEIPRWTNAKLEINKEDKFNPILQDTKKGKLRFVRNCFPHKGYIWNYGAFPQTWEDPNHQHPDTKANGDNDPLDVCEIGEAVGYTGQIKQVKVLGVMALLDDGETDWKIIAIDVKDPHASKVNDIEDVERHFPGLLRATNEWFRIYKIPDGKPENQFAFSGESKNKAYAQDIVRQCNAAWDHLIAGKEDKHGISTVNSTLNNAETTAAQVPAASPQADAAIDSSIDKWFYISGASV